MIKTVIIFILSLVTSIFSMPIANAKSSHGNNNELCQLAVALKSFDSKKRAAKIRFNAPNKAKSLTSQLKSLKPKSQNGFKITPVKGPASSKIQRVNVAVNCNHVPYEIYCLSTKGSDYIQCNSRNVG